MKEEYEDMSSRFTPSYVKFEDLPEDIKRVALIRKIQNPNNGYNKCDLNDFIWHDTPEGCNIWWDINNNDYESFYNYYDKIIEISYSELIDKINEKINKLK